MASVKRSGNRTNIALAVLTILMLTPVAARAQWSTGDNSNDIRSTNSGNIGVGTTTPPAKLTVSVTNNADGIVVDGTTNPMFSLKSSGVAKAYFGLATTVGGYVVGASPGDVTLRSQGGKLFLDTNSGVGTPALTILGGNGGIGIGTSTPANALHVHSALGAQAIRVSGNGVGFINFMDTAAPANQKLYQWRSEGGLFRMSLANDSESSFAQQNLIVANSSGNIGIGAAPASGSQYKLAVSGNVSASGNLNVTGAITGGTINATYQDVAEWVPSTQRLSAGTVVVLDTGGRTNYVLASTKAYDTGVAGVISASPGVILGEGGAGKLMVATTGRVKVKVDATRVPIKVGDLLVSSDEEGVAMKSVEVDLGNVKIHRPGTIIGKALEPLASGTGEILVLLSLH